MSNSNTDWLRKGIDAGAVFTPASPIDEQSLFAGRDDQVMRIIDVINQPGQHAILYGERGVGKTSLTNVLAAFLHGQSILKPRVNCDSTDSFDSVWRKAFEEAQLTQTKPGLGFIGKSHVRSLDFESLAGATATPDSIRRALKLLSQHFVPVFVFDEFDRLPAKPRRAFADTIKNLSDNSVSATVILVGVADSVDGLIQEHKSVQRALVQVRMPRMSDSESEDVLQKGTSKLGMTMEPAARRRIVKLAQGLPHYTHLLGLYACRAALDARTLNVSATAVEEALNKALQGAQQTTLSTYNTATRSARKNNLFAKVLLSCAMAETNEAGEFAAQDIREPLRRITGRDYDIPNFAQHLKEFCDAKRGPVLLQTGITRLFRYKFIDPLLQPYVVMQGIKDGLIKLSDLD